MTSAVFFDRRGNEYICLSTYHYENKYWHAILFCSIVTVEEFYADDLMEIYDQVSTLLKSFELGDELESTVKDAKIYGSE